MKGLAGGSAFGWAARDGGLLEAEGEGRWRSLNLELASVFWRPALWVVPPGPPSRIAHPYSTHPSISPPFRPPNSPARRSCFLVQVKHLLYEHQNNVTQLKEAGEMALKLQLEEHQVQT